LIVFVRRQVKQAQIAAVCRFVPIAVHGRHDVLHALQRQIFVEGAVRVHETDPVLDLLLVLDVVQAEHADCPAVPADEVHEQLDGGRLARPVAADEAVDEAPFHRKRNVVEAKIPVALADLVKDDDVFHGNCLLAGRAAGCSSQASKP